MTPEQRAVIEAARALAVATARSYPYPTLTSLRDALTALDQAPVRPDPRDVVIEAARNYAVRFIGSLTSVREAVEALDQAEAAHNRHYDAPGTLCARHARGGGANGDPAGCLMCLAEGDGTCEGEESGDVPGRPTDKTVPARSNPGVPGNERLGQTELPPRPLMDPRLARTEPWAPGVRGPGEPLATGDGYRCVSF